MTSHVTQTACCVPDSALTLSFAWPASVAQHSGWRVVHNVCQFYNSSYYLVLVGLTQECRSRRVVKKDTFS